MDMDMIRTRLGLKPVDKQWSVPVKAGQQLSVSRVVESLGHHLYTLYLFSATDIDCIIATSMVFGFLNAAIAPALSMGPALTVLGMIKAAPVMLLQVWGVLLLTEFHNQRHPESTAEDLINKPWRPVPSGRVTTQQVNILLYLIYPFNILVSSMVGGLVPCLTTSVFAIWYNEFGGAADPFLKGWHNGVGITGFWAGTLEVATGSSIFSGEGTAAVWLAILMAMVTTTSQMQDFRDMDGDAAAGRKTIPLVIGDMPSRILSGLSVFAWTATTCWYWNVSWQQGMLPTVTALALVGNLFRDRTRKGDAITWKLWSPWVFSLFFMPFLKHYQASSW
nr:(-)-epi-alpha-bisabolol synthase [Stachybotrys sp.]